MNREKCRHADAFHEQFTHPMPGTLRRNHRDIDECRRHDLAEMNIEPVSKHQRLASAKVRLDGRLENSLLSLIGNENHDHVGILRCLLNRRYRKSVVLCASSGWASCIRRYSYVDTAVAHVQSVCMPLAAVTDDRNPFGFDQARISVFFV